MSFHGSGLPRKVILLPALLLLALFSACAVVNPAPSPTSTPTPLPLPPTATIQWFPATRTHTPFPTPAVTVTPEYRPGLMDSLLTDVFTDPTLWNTVSSPLASVLVKDGQLTLSIPAYQPSTSLLSLRASPLVADFYLEAVVRLNLCRADDRYGVVFRAAYGSYYRYVLNCRGQTRFERIIDGTASAPRDWQPAADAPLGAPGEVRIGIWASGAEMRFFLNDRYQFTILDGTLQSGSLGLYAASAADTPLSLSFTSLAVQRVSFVSPTPAVLATPVP